MKLLIIGGTGFISGHVVRKALEQQHEVWVVTRGNKPLPDGVTALRADRRDREAFRKVIEGAEVIWDGVLDCICMEPEDARQDIEVFRNRAGQVVMISTDNVYDPERLGYPQSETAEYYASEGYGGNKRLCELVFQNTDTGNLKWTVIRTGHVYGPGSKLGAMPPHVRDEHLLDRLKAGEILELAGGGHFLQQPNYVSDLAELLISCVGNPNTYNEIFVSGGPKAIEARYYFQIIADHLGVPLRIRELPVDEYMATHPQERPFLCNRIWDLSKLKKAGVKVPSTPIEEGLRIHVDSLLEKAESGQAD